MKVSQIWVNCPDDRTARTISEALVGERLVASANIYGPIESAYHWRGGVERAREVPVLLKTRSDLFDAVARRVAEMHPYEVPSIVAVELDFVNREYRDWIAAETRAARP